MRKRKQQRRIGKKARRSSSRWVDPETRRAQKSLNRAMRVLALVRRTGRSLASVAREEHIDPRTVRKYVGSEFRGQKRRPTKADGRTRNILIPTALGNADVTVHGSKQASRLGRYMSAVGKYLHTGDTDALEEFAGQSIAGHLLITDPSTLDHLAAAGSLQLDSIYALPESSS
jgi:hypothetical protein